MLSVFVYLSSVCLGSQRHLRQLLCLATESSHLPREILTCTRYFLRLSWTLPCLPITRRLGQDQGRTQAS